MTLHDLSRPQRMAGSDCQAQEWGFESRIGALEKSSGAFQPTAAMSQAGDASEGGRLKGGGRRPLSTLGLGPCPAAI